MNSGISQLQLMYLPASQSRLVDVKYTIVSPASSGVSSNATKFRLVNSVEEKYEIKIYSMFGRDFDNLRIVLDDNLFDIELQAFIND